MNVIVFINHVYLVLSANSFHEIKDNAFLNTHFANIEHKVLHSGTGLDWEGIYIRGQDTYIEFFYPQGDVQFSKQWNSGIGLGTDKVGALDTVYNNLKQAVPDVVQKTFTRTVEGVEQDWFTYVTQKESFIAPNLSLWCMEYNKEYCKSDDVSRKAYNAPYYDPTKIFKNITGLTIAVDKEYQDNFIDILRASGYTCTAEEKHHFICKIQDFTIEVIQASDTIKGIRQITLELNTSVDSQVLKLGETTLTLENTKGTWAFM